VTLHECPPNGQGLVAILATKLAAGFDLDSTVEADRQHLLIECMRMAFADGLAYIADPDAKPVPLEELLQGDYIDGRRRRIDPARAGKFVEPGVPRTGDDTVYLSVVDGEGNAISLIQSNYMGVGTGLVVPGTGILLQNRGAGFVLKEGHPNCIGPRKRPYHTIIPAMTTKGGELHACFGVMGGFMQPQGHLQVLSHLVDRQLGPQAALDAPRWQLGGRKPGAPDPGGPVLVEEGFDPEVLSDLSGRGHDVRVVSGWSRLHFGGGQIILRDPKTGVLTGGSDPRKDGCAAGF
jgi:gamma-glutamyltranspeptidase/glutathione hydrolase